MSKPRAISRKSAKERPDVFRYHDYRAFLRDWIEYRKSKSADFTVRVLAEKAGLTPAYLSMVLSGARELSDKSYLKLATHLQLNPSERAYLENLLRLGMVDSPEIRFSAVDRMTKYANYQKHNPNEAKLAQFMGKWHHLAIHQMARLPGFNPDPEWIRERLNFSVPLQQIRDGLEFLFESGYLKRGADGIVSASDDTIKCDDEIYTMVLIEFYKQMHTLATASLEKTPPAERNLEGFTVTMNPKRFEKAREILSRALDEIEKLEKSEDGGNDSVYQVEVALFPLTKRGIA